ncbi:MAG: hypothetical protein JOZ47_01765 [Kutzneria sp.]|nr:hypothetical protein [Kutzneria sp.]MBV9843789.1 hypothetical protein [Kutzneria sp.]
MVSNLATLHQRLKPYFSRARPHDQAGKYIAALMSDPPRKNGWTIAVHTGDATPDPTQRLLNHAVWDHEQTMRAVRGFVAEPQLAIDICRDMLADATMPAWAAGDEVYGRSSQLRELLEDNEIGYVMRVGRAFHAAVVAGVSARAEDLVARHVGPGAWQVCSVAGPRANAATPGRGSRPPALGITCSSAGIWPPVTWPSTTASCPTADPSR